MDGHISEQQQVEEIRKWLKENATSIIGGIAIGLAIVFGWRAWTAHRQGEAQQASAAYAQMVANITAGRIPDAIREGEAIITQHGDTTYATFAALILARGQIAQANDAAARAHLQWAISNAPREELRQLAQLRLARVLLSESKPDEALQQIDAVPADRYAVIRGELLGDAWRAKGGGDKAREAYRQALTAAGKDNDPLQANLQMKLDDLGVTPAAEQKP